MTADGTANGTVEERVTADRMYAAEAIVEGTATANRTATRTLVELEGEWEGRQRQSGRRWQWGGPMAE